MSSSVPPQPFHLLRTIRGALGLGAALVWVGLVGLPSILLLGVPGRFVSPARRLAWVAVWARTQSSIVLALLRLGGARFERHGELPSFEPGIVVMNHQSVLDIPTACVMSPRHMPAFITRARYTRVPMISTGLWLNECPVIDPGLDREGAVKALTRIMAIDRAFLIFPEGHRSPDGELQPFRTKGLLAMLGARRVPVWLVATDGFHSSPRLLDLVQLHLIDGVTEVVGRFEPPAEPDALPAFLDELHARLGAHIAGMRARRAAR